MIVREAVVGEAEAVGALRVDAYMSGGFLSPGTGYAQTLRALGFGADRKDPGGGHAIVLVAAGDETAASDVAAGDTAGETGGDPAGETGATVGGAVLRDGGNGGKLLGTVMLEPWHAGSEVSRGPGEAEVRAFAVAPWAQGRGVGRALMLAVIDAAAANGAHRLLLSTQPQMKAAQHLYRSLGFVRTPELDWMPVPEVTLWGFALPLRSPGAARNNFG